MSFFNKLESKYGRYAIHNLMNYFMVLYVIGFVICLVPSSGGVGLYYMYLSLDVPMILRGQIWRLITFLMYPPSTSIVFGIIMIILYYQLGNILERVWGAFKFNFFMFMGVLMHIIAAFVLYFALGIPVYLTPDNLNLSIFLAFALTFPDMQFLIYFVIPIKAKYLAAFYGILVLLNMVVGSLETRISIFLSLFNFILFFLLTRKHKNANYWEAKRKREFMTATKVKPEGATRHRCAVCGRTELDSPDMEFRFCSKCKGNYEYCSEHLFTHKHVGLDDSQV